MLTLRQRHLLDYIERFVETHGRPPRHMDMAAYLGVSQGAVGPLLQQLHDRGVIRWHRDKVRGIEVVRRTVPDSSIDLASAQTGDAVTRTDDGRVVITLDGVTHRPRSRAEAAALVRSIVAAARGAA